MNEEIRVHVSSNGRNSKSRNLLMRYKDPETGLRVTRSTGTRNRRQAERVAAKWEAELREGRYAAPSKTTWEDFTLRYFGEAVPGLAESTGRIIGTVFTRIERICKPKRLVDLDETRLARFVESLRRENRTEPTIKCYLAHLQASLRWAHGRKMLAVVPKIPKIHRGTKKGGKIKPMKGRPLLDAEFERLIDVTPKVVPHDEGIMAWRHYLEGLWLSGLRLSESLNLYWDRRDRLCVDLSGRRPTLWIPAECQKRFADEYLPITPDFVEFLFDTPEDQRHGRVFRPTCRRRAGLAGRSGAVSETLRMIGKSAGVEVSTHPKTGKVKYASAHDLRRSYGSRWAKSVRPAILQLLMRHESIDTTMGYYVDLDAQEAADVIWEAYEQSGHTLGHTRRIQPGSETENPEKTGVCGTATTE